MAVKRTETPYGAIDERTQIYKRTGSGAVGDKHTGRFSDDNPYAYQLEEASQDDVDALFERAFEWEANRLALIEQREYDDPSAVVSRQRAAGVNPDLIGSSSGSGSGSSAQISPVDGDEPFGGSRQNLNEAQTMASTMQTIVAPLNAVSGIVQTAVGATDALSTLPARIGLTEAQKQLVGEQAETVKQLRPAQVISAQLQNIGSQLDQLGEYGTLFTSDTSDADILSLLGTLGYDDKQSVDILKHIRASQANPALQAAYAEGRLKARQRAVQEQLYTTKFISGLEGFSAQIAVQERRYKLGHLRLANDIQEYLLADESYVKNVANSQFEDARAGNVQSQLARLQVERNLEAFVASIYYNKKVYNDYESEIKSIYEGAKNRDLTSIEQLRVRELQAKQVQLTTLTDKALSDTFNLASDLNANRHYNEHATFEIGGFSLPNPFYDVLYKPLFKFDANSIFNGEDTSNTLYNALLHRCMPNAYDEEGNLISIEDFADLVGKISGTKAKPIR